MKGFTYNQVILCRGEIRLACAELLEDMQEQKNKPDAGTICTVVILAELRRINYLEEGSFNDKSRAI